MIAFGRNVETLSGMPINQYSAVQYTTVVLQHFRVKDPKLTPEISSGMPDKTNSVQQWFSNIFMSRTHSYDMYSIWPRTHHLKRFCCQEPLSDKICPHLSKNGGTPLKDPRGSQNTHLEPMSYNLELGLWTLIHLCVLSLTHSENSICPALSLSLFVSVNVSLCLFASLSLLYSA